MKINIEINIKENPVRVTPSEIKCDIEYVIIDYLNGQSITADIKAEINES